MFSFFFFLLFLPPIHRFETNYKYVVTYDTLSVQQNKMMHFLNESLTYSIVAFVKKDLCVQRYAPFIDSKLFFVFYFYFFRCVRSRGACILTMCFFPPFLSKRLVDKAFLVGWGKLSLPLNTRISKKCFKKKRK